MTNVASAFAHQTWLYIARGQFTPVAAPLAGLSCLTPLGALRFAVASG